MEFILGTLFFVVVLGWLDTTIPWRGGEADR